MLFWNWEDNNEHQAVAKGVPDWCPAQKLTNPVDSIYRMNTEFYSGTEGRNWTG